MPDLNITTGEEKKALPEAIAPQEIAQQPPEVHDLKTLTPIPEAASDSGFSMKEFLQQGQAFVVQKDVGRVKNAATAQTITKAATSPADLMKRTLLRLRRDPHLPPAEET